MLHRINGNGAKEHAKKLILSLNTSSQYLDIFMVSLFLNYNIKYLQRINLSNLTLKLFLSST